MISRMRSRTAVLCLALFIVYLLSFSFVLADQSGSGVPAASTGKSADHLENKPSAVSNPADSARNSASVSLVIKEEEEVLQKLKKAKTETRADLLYDLGKFCFEHHDNQRAIKYMLESLAAEEHLNRPEQAAKSHLALAIVYAMNKKFDDSFAEYNKSLEVARKARLKEYEALVLDSIGMLAFKTGRLDDADKYFKEAYKLSEEDGRVFGQINSLVNQASVMRRRKDDKAAFALLAKAIDLSKEGEQDRSLAHALVNLAQMQSNVGSLEDAVKTYRRAVALFKEELDVEAEAKACWGLADTLYFMHKTKEAQDAFKQGIDALSEEPDSAVKIDCLIGAGSTEADLGHFEHAQKLHMQAYEMASALKLRTKELDAVLQMGNDYLLSGYPEAGLYRLLDGERILDQGDLDVKSKGTFLIAIGRCYKSLGQNESAQKYYEEAFKLFQDIDDKASMAMALNSLAVLALDNRNSADFDNFYQQAKEIYAGSGNKRDLAIMDYNYAQYLLVEKKTPEAITKYESALEGIKNTGDRISEGLIMRGLGLAELVLRHPQKAMAYYEKALDIADASGEIEAQWDSHLGLGKAYKRLGLNDMALTHLNKSVELVEKERGQLTRDSFKTYNLDLRNECFLELVDLYIRLSKPSEALVIAEKGRARAFLDMLSSRKHGRRVESFEAPLSSKARTDLDGKPDLNLLAMAPAEAGSRGVSVLPRASQIYASSAISPVNAAAPDLNEIKNLVQKSKSTVLEYFILPDEIAVWVIDPDSKIHMLNPIRISRDALSEKVSLMYEAITHHPKNQDEVRVLARRRQDLMRELYDDLIKPVEQYLPANEHDLVTIVPHGPMFMIPFAALMSADRKFLVEKHTIAYVPAIGVMRATQKLAQSVANEPDRLLAFGNPITKAISFLEALPYSEKEVQHIAKLFGEGNSLVKIGESANKKTFEDLASKYTELHLATHGLVDEEHPMQSSLVLAPSKSDDGLLTVKDILAMKEIRAKLVVLSACQTGRGKITGDGVVGLSRAFIIAGTPSVLVSQWNVDDVITEYQMNSFYKGYLEKIGRCKSLRQAQLDTIKLMEGKDYGQGSEGIRANPRYWAAFQMIGESS